MLEIGKTYKVNSQRKGKFTMKVTSLHDPFVTGIIVDGHASAMMQYNERDKGEEVSVRESLCTFTEQP